jgi:phosphopantothenoylcysteine decarboxylase/phosphopantothenate--cysteine ligase
LARNSDLLVVAPATANVLAKFAGGIADDFLSTIYLSTTTSVVVAPAMNVEMWNHTATRRNIEILRDRGVLQVGPGSGYQACGEYGPGRLAEPVEIVDCILSIVRKPGSLEGINVLITAGPTVEDIDPVRFISNRSSGKMGFAIAEEAKTRGARVTLVAGPVKLPTPYGVDRIDVRSAEEMAAQVLDRYVECDVIVKAAAVADFKPARIADRKLKKSNEPEAVSLIPTRDILLELGRLRQPDQILVGFAAESENLRENALGKLKSKGLDLIVANDISRSDSGFDVDSNEALILDRNMNETFLPRMSKKEIASRIWDQIEVLLSGKEDKLASSEK